MLRVAVEYSDKGTFYFEDVIDVRANGHGGLVILHDGGRSCTAFQLNRVREFWRID